VVPSVGLTTVVMNGGVAVVGTTPNAENKTNSMAYCTPCLKKTVQNCFCQNFVKFPPILTIFGRQMATKLKLCEVHSFPTSP